MELGRKPRGGHCKNVCILEELGKVRYPREQIELDQRGCGKIKEDTVLSVM